jgi:RNA polymerase-interacting CarD/CdnL/TRCF family regulator
MKLAADKEAGNKIQNEINKAKLDKEKEKLKKAQDDIKNKTDQLQKNRDALIDSGKVENGDQILRREKLEREVQELKIKERRLTSSVAEIENLIEE